MSQISSEGTVLGIDLDATGRVAALADGFISPADLSAVNRSDVSRTWGYDVRAINAEHALVLMGTKAVVVKERPSGPIEDRVRILSLEAFYAWFANQFTEIVAADGKPKVISWGKAWAADRDRRQFDGVEFFPNPDGAKGTSGYLNLWRGFGVKPSDEGSYGIFRDHLLNNVCGGNVDLFKWVFGWFAHLVQRPRERIGTALVLRGRMGSGKTKVGEVIGSLFPAHYFPVDDARYITGQFNAHMASCLLLQAEEAVWAGDKAAEGRLKGLITSERQMIEQKGIDPIRIRNYVRVLMTSNEDWVVPAGKDERRFCVLDVHPRCAQNHRYFAEMDDELNRGGRARLFQDLLLFDLGTVNLRQIPRTEALFEQKIRSLDTLESWWFSRLTDGTATRGGETWPRQITVDTLYSDYSRAADEVGRRKLDRATFGVKLLRLVPGVTKVRPRLADEAGERRVWCYDLPGLETCRNAFESLLGQSAGWPDASEQEEAAEIDNVVP